MKHTSLLKLLLMQPVCDTYVGVLCFAMSRHNQYTWHWYCSKEHIIARLMSW